MSEKSEYIENYGTFWKKEEVTAVIDWWRSLRDLPGERARLRRCREPLQVMLEPGFYRLLNSLGSQENNKIFALAMAAGLISHVKEDTGRKSGSFGNQLGQAKEGGNKPRFSEIRFSQLQKCRDSNELYNRVRRVIQLLDGNVNIVSLAEFILAWNRENNGKIDRDPSKRLQFLLAKDYFLNVFKLRNNKNSK